MVTAKNTGIVNRTTTTTKAKRTPRTKPSMTLTAEELKHLLEEQRNFFTNAVIAQNQLLLQELERNRLTTSQDFVNLTSQLKNLSEQIAGLQKQPGQKEQTTGKEVKPEDLLKFGFLPPEPLHFFPFVRQDGLAAALSERLKTATIPQFQILRQASPQSEPEEVMTFREVVSELLTINPKRLVKNFDIMPSFVDNQIHLMTPGNKISQVVETHVLVDKFVTFVERLKVELGEKKTNKMWKKWKVVVVPLGYPENGSGVFPVTKMEDLYPQVG